MTIAISEAVAAKDGNHGPHLRVKSVDVAALGPLASPICLFDDFRVSGTPFGPHPHAGFSQITYVFPDSSGANRSRDSLGNDIVVGPGGVVWTQAGSGMLHQEVPADTSRELHGLQVFVNLSAKSKFIAPRVLHLAAEDVPLWQDPDGDAVRVVVGSFGTVSSPLVPEEPFDLLDVELQNEIVFDLAAGRNGFVYVLQGPISILCEGREREIQSGHALALSGDGRVTFAAARAANFLILSGLNIREPVFAQGPFIMNNRSQMDQAFARFQAGKMGHLEPL
jgi:redox-sensitive bicupin YhaK (pirin superfamily)